MIHHAGFEDSEPETIEIPPEDSIEIADIDSGSNMDSSPKQPEGQSILSFSSDLNFLTARIENLERVSKERISVLEDRVQTLEKDLTDAKSDILDIISAFDKSEPTTPSVPINIGASSSSSVVSLEAPSIITFLKNPNQYRPSP